MQLQYDSLWNQTLEITDYKFNIELKLYSQSISY